jgi:hypothetical protein
MNNNFIKSFSRYLVEGDQDQMPTGQLKGYTSEQIIGRIGEMMEIMSDGLRFGVPSDTYGHATTYRDANGAIEKIRDMQHYYETKGEQVRFYCWNINYGGSWEASQSLKQKVEEFGGFGKNPNNINLKKLIEYFTQNPEDVDNVRSISISMDSEAIRKFAIRNSKKDEVPAQAETPAEPANQQTQSTQTTNT